MNKLILGMVMAAMLVACSAPASATWGAVPLSGDARSVVWENVTASSLYIDYDSDFLKQYTYQFNVPSGTEVRTQLCIDIWSSNSCGQEDFIFNGCGQGCSGDFPFGTYQFGKDGSGCGDPVCDEHQNVAGNGCGGNGIWWNVTGLVTSGATNNFVANRNTTECTFDGRHRGANIVHLCNDASGDTLYAWFNQGMEDGTPIHVDIHNVDKDLATEWTLYVCIDCGDYGDTVRFNGHDFTFSGDPHWMAIDSYDVTAYVLDGENDVDLISTDDYFHPFWTLLVGRVPASEPKPDLTVTEIDAEMVRPDTGQTVTATVLNQGDAGTGVAFDVRLEVDGSSYATVENVGPLTADENTTVSFTVNLNENCHNFTVIADSNGDVDEGVHEDNNALSEDHQVGYVIVVRSDSDFASLDLATYVDGTYYIEDLTIENCAGNAITIESTTVPFVISDCTVQNCVGSSEVSGIYLHDLSNGRIDNCTVKDNIGKGIRVQNSSYVEIMDNEIFNNTGYGIEVYPRTLGVPGYVGDCKFIEIVDNMARENYYGIEVIGYNCIVEGNTARNNDDYGVYLYGKYNEIYNNIIEDSGNYGMKVYNSSDNYIYWNNFTNNGGGAQGWDNRATNIWNTATSAEYPYESIYTNFTGNYWDDHTTPDADGDGIVDAAYPIDGGAGAKDSYPLVTLPWRFDISIYNGKNIISTPLVQDDPSLGAVFGDNPVNMDRVFRYINDGVNGAYKSAYYWGGNWYGEVGSVEPIEPEVGYVYQSQGADYNLAVLGKRCTGTISTPIYNGKNLIGYVNFTETDLSTFSGSEKGGPVNMDRVFWYVNGAYKSAYYWNGEWYGDDIPIRAGVGYVYMRQSVLFYWTYEA